MTVGEQLELVLKDVRPPWQGRSPRELTKCRLRFPLFGRKIGGTGRANQDAGLRKEGAPALGALLQYDLFPKEEL